MSSGRPTTLDAVKYLAAQCNYATTWDSRGYNKFDADFGHSLAERERLTVNQEKAAIKMLRKYRGQLSAGGIDWQDLVTQFTERMTTEREPETKSALRIDVMGDRFVVFSPYNKDLVEAMRRVPDRRWYGKDNPYMGMTNVNTVPLGRSLEIEELAKRFGFQFTDAARQQIDSNRKVAVAEKARVEALVAASKADDADIDLKVRGLYPFQRAGVQYALEARRTFIADEMGLGKTIQALAAVEQELAFPVLVIAPQTVAGKWVRETQRWLPHRSVQRLVGDRRFDSGCEVTIVHYDALPKRLELFTNGFKSLIVDESHMVKNRKAKRTEMVKFIASKLDDPDPMILFLSGTPASNGRPAELITQLTIMRRLEDLGGFHYFWKHYCGESQTGRENMNELNVALRSHCFVRRLKKNVLPELPPRVFAPVPVDIDNLAEYRFAEREFLAWVKSMGGNVLSAARAETLARLTALRHLAAKGKLAESLTWIHEFLEEEQKLVVFAHHRDIQQGVLAEVSAYNPRVIEAGQSDEERERNWMQFQEDESIRVIVVSLEAGGQGIDLYAASNAVFLELPWTPKDILQAIDRCHRIGQTDSVTGWQLLAPDTIDDFMQELLDEKLRDFEDMHDGASSADAEVSIVAGLIDRMQGRKVLV